MGSSAGALVPGRQRNCSRTHRRRNAGRADYRALAPQFAALARLAWLSVPVVASLAIATFLWNHRRLPEQSGTTRSRSVFQTVVRSAAERLTRRNPETQAGFFFTWQTLTRSASHRTMIAVAVAAGCTHLLLALAASGVHRHELDAVPLATLGINTIVLL